MMTKDWAIVFCSAIALVLINHRANAKPMDSVAAEKLPELKAIVQTVSGSGLSPADIERLRESLRSGDPVLISIASWCALRLGSQGDLLQPELSQLTERIGDMPYAFVTLAKEEKSGRQLSAVKRKERLEKLVASENPYLKVEAAKQLLKLRANSENLRGPKERIQGSLCRILMRDMKQSLRS